MPQLHWRKYELPARKGEPLVPKDWEGKDDYKPMREHGYTSDEEVQIRPNFKTQKRTDRLKLDHTKKSSGLECI